MSNLSAFPDLAAAREQAAEWIVRMDRGLSAAEQPVFSQWLRGTANRRAFEELGGLWKDLDVVSVLAEVYPRPAARTSRRMRALLAAGAAAALLAAVALQFMPRGTAPLSAPAGTTLSVETLATAVGEQKTFTLRDGSLLTLNTDSRVEVSLSKNVRKLSLRRGEAHFEVAHDAARPFVVAAGALAVRAVGTAFNVRLRDSQGTDVLVTSGTVRISEPAHDAAPASMVNAGELLALRADGTRDVRRLDATAMESRLAWRRSVLIFDGETLAQALGEFSRYTPRHLYLADPGLGKVRIAGYFPTDNLSVLLASLRANFGIVATETATGLRLAAAAERAPQK
ncbi:MAG: FecR domain-containing protein [Steroidobacteraceae bacterium]